MSTKTTFKRIALVAVAAMGFGLLSLAPASAASQADTLALSATASSTSVGVAVSITVSQSYIGSNSDSMTVTASLNSSPATSVALPVLTSVGVGNVNSLPVISGSSLISNTNGVSSSTLYTTGVTTVTLTPAIAGTYVVRLTPTVNAGGGILQAAAQTWTVTATNGVADSTSTSFIGAVGSTPTVDATISVAKTTNTQVASILVAPKVASVAVAPTVALTATISGPGTIGIGSSVNPTSSGRSITGAAGSYHLSVFADGTAGVATITISAGSLVIGTETVTFYGANASYVSTASKTNIGVAETGTLTITSKDASGTAGLLGTIYAVSSNTATATVSVSGGVVTVTGVAAGSANVTICDTALCASPTVSLVVPVVISKTTAASVALSFDKATYAPGALMTVAVTALDSTGLGVADGSRSIFSAAGITSNTSLTGATWTAAAAVTLVAGKATFTAYAPALNGSVVTLSATQGAAIDAVIAGGTAAVVTISTSVVDAAVTAAATATADAIAAAADAAAEATDAANAATDAANAAAEAADAATAAAQDAADAVASLSVQVAELVAGLQAQIAAQKAAITALTNLVIKIQKKLKA